MRRTLCLKRARRLSVVGLALASLSTIGCGRQSQSSELADIYTTDALTRHEANDEEVLWTVNVGGCSGSLLNSQYLLTANHCNVQSGRKLRSGAAIKNNADYDMQVVRIVENSPGFDYAIAEITWLTGEPNAEQRYTPFILTDSADITTGRDEVATKLFTVGFPTDKRVEGQGAVPTYSEGHAKRFTSYTLKYNLGSINGNSGGAVWTVDTNTLVSLTNAGPHMYGQTGWDQNDPENPQAWNWGARMDEVYKVSPTLQKIFQGGDNRFVDDNGNLIDAE